MSITSPVMTSQCLQKATVLIGMLFGMLLVVCQEPNPIMGKKDYSSAMKLDSTLLNSLYVKYKEEALYHRRFKHEDIDSLIKTKRDGGAFAVTQIGASAEGRSIYELEYGDGDIKVMLWSQMHGDEPTATMALFDLFNFLESDGGEEAEVRALLKEKLHIHVIPMLNPDGAELYIRRNAQSVDLNRDARVGQTVEGKLLLERGQAVKPHFGFNLHDQSIYYHVPNTQNPVAIAMLAPAYNVERDINESRGNAMRLIAGMNQLLQQYIPDAVAKYDDTYSPRGFGDKFQSWGASTVLIESGGLKGDPEKQEIRRLNFVIILNSLIEIAQGSYGQYDIEGYDDIPFNASSLLHDVVLKGVDLGTQVVPLTADVAIRRGETTVGRDYHVRGWVEDLGDLQESFGYAHVDADGLKFEEGTVAPTPISSLQNFTHAQALDLLRQGYLAVRLTGRATPQTVIHDFPINIFRQDQFFATKKIDLGGTANFFLIDGSGERRFAIVNGYLVDLREEAPAGMRNRIL